MGTSGCYDCPPTPVHPCRTGRHPKVTARSRIRSATRQLLAKRGERLVVGQGAAVALRGERAGSRAGLGRGGSLGLERLGDRSLVLLPASLSSRVLLLPLLALGVGAFLPRLSLDVEALGVLVLPVLVVLRDHAVEGRVELGAVGVDRLVRLLERERDAATLEVDVDDLDEDLFADRDDLLSELDVLARELRDVHEALDAVCDAHERTERDELGDLARSNLADGVGAGEDLPRVLLRRLERERHALAVQVDLEDLDGDLL